MAPNLFASVDIWRHAFPSTGKGHVMFWIRYRAGGQTGPAYVEGSPKSRFGYVILACRAQLVPTSWMLRHEEQEYYPISRAMTLTMIRAC